MSEQETKVEITDGTDITEEVKESKPNDPEKTYTESQVQKMIKERLAREAAAKEKAVAEAEKLSKMNQDEKKKYEKERLVQENEELKAQVARIELGKEASKQLVTLGIDPSDEVLEIVVRDDAESTISAIKAFSAAVNKEAEKRTIKQNTGVTPKVVTGTSTVSRGEQAAKERNARKKPPEINLWK